ncbi:MAG: ABC transporter permease [Deltaproteobacteria bacterium]|nr:ABC transporter permease [Deltaproteobacteria bacterium]
MAGDPIPRRRTLNIEMVISLGVLLSSWQVASHFLPEYVLPGFQLIFEEFVKMAREGTLFWDTLLTLYRILRGLVAGFIVGALFGVIMGTVRKTEHYLMPAVNFIMGIPALSWTLIVILWFRGTETRILVLMLAISFPVFAHSVLDAVKGVSKEWMEMTLVFRPTRGQVFRMLILPSIIPHVLTAWKVTVGFAVRVVIVAELVGASTGVGYRMLQQQSLLNMSGVLAWTLVLVVSGLGMQFVISTVESRLLRWRPTLSS